MPQKTNLNVSPYYDDFNIDKNFYRVLFKPGFPVQARELTALQSILQNQVETFGSHIFKEGSMVIPGSITYDDTYYSVKIKNQHLGIDVLLYLNELIDKKVIGQTSGITATIENYSIPPDDGVEDVTLYVKYSDSGSDLETTTFEDDEILVILENITYGNTTINSGETVASLLEENATFQGFSVGVSAGVYFIRGTFVNVPSSLVILEPYSNTPSYRVGFSIFEEVITSDDDLSLVDNAKGFSNYTSPGADRLKISTVLTKKSLDDFDDKNFVELIRIENGTVKKIQDKSVYSIIKEYFAKRTFEESGDYSLQNFDIDVLNSLNDRISNGGIYLPNQKTEQGNVPSDNLMCVRVSPGVAYVRGYDISIPSSTIIDVQKPRDTQKVPTALIPFEIGNLIKVNNVVGTPFIGINTSGNIVDLYNLRRDDLVTNAGTGTNIGKARVYAFGVSDAPYTGASTEWDLYLFDIQTYTKLDLNNSLTSIQCPATSFIKGLSSGASGYVNTAAGGSSIITLIQTSGTFIVGEQISINGLTTTPRSIKSITSYNTEDIKSIYQDSTTLSSGQLKTDFIADTVLYPVIPNQFSSTSKINISTLGSVSSSGNNFLGIRSDSIIVYEVNNPSITSPTFNKVNFVSPDGLTMSVSGVGTVNSVCDGGLPTSAEFTTFRLAVPEILNTDNPSLFVPLSNNNISSVDLSLSNLILSTQIREQTTNSSGQMTININSTGITSAFFESYDAERYSVFYNDGTIENLTSDQVTLTENGTKVVFSGLTPNKTGNVSVNVTVRKNNITNKTKDYVRSSTLTVDKTSSGVTTSTNGLTQNNYYGLRIEDNDISLNVPDVVEVVAVYESLTNTRPVLDKLSFPSGLSLDTASIVGEKIIGNNSGAIAQLVSRTSSIVDFVYLNSKRFETGETVVFQESSISTVITSITKGSYLDISKRYILDKGQKDQFYDYSKIVRTGASSVPSRQLLVIFNHYVIPSNDQGDLITVNSYDQERYLKDIPIVAGNIRSTDTLDFRPRVSQFTSITSSPFDFNARTFEFLSSYSVLTPNESSTIGYNFYLPRIDKVVLNKLGQFSVIKGTSAVQPKSPLNVEDVMDIATISLPAYLYNPTDARINLVDNRRYTMRDIGRLEQRIKNLEDVTALSLLEADTKSLQIQDADGLSRYKSGFFVDDFKDTSFISFTNPDVKCDVDVQNRSLISAVDFWSLKAELALSPGINQDAADLSTNLPLLDPNVQKTGDLVTLAYTEKSWLEQPLASDIENVNPFTIIDYTGAITLNPASDSWVRNIYINSTKTEFNPIISIRMRRVRSGNRFQVLEGPAGNREGSTAGTSRTGLRWANPFNPEERVLGAPVVSVQNVNRRWSVVNFGGREYDYVESVNVVSEPDLFARSRNVEFRANGLRALSQHYHFIDDISNLDIIPKLVEIEMISGAFQIGEEVVGFPIDDSSVPIIIFRCAQPNHKSGSYNSPTKVYTFNPYDRDETIPSDYSSTSNLLNIDTFSLAEESLTKYNGYIEVGTEFIGSASGAVARVSNIRLVSDALGDIIGCFFIRDPNEDPLPLIRINTGSRVFKLTSDSVNSSPLPGEETSKAQTTYSTNGTIQTQYTSTVQVRNPPPPPPLPPRPRPRRDPLAQSFTVDETGAFITSVDVYFATKDPSQKLFVELRTVELGTPTNNLVQDYAFVELEPDDIQTSEDASVPTRVTFPSPVYLSANTEYALVFLAPSSKLFNMWVGTMGEPTVGTQTLPDAESVVVSKQYIGGSLFKSQNGTIWTASQYQDLKFKLYKANFNLTGGEVIFYNPALRARGSSIPYMIENGLRTLPRKVTAGITTTYVLDSVLVSGKKVTDGTETYGFVERVGGPISGQSGISGLATGIGYSAGSFSSVNLYNIIGSGSGALANLIFDASGGLTSISIASTGNGYSVGDVLGITTSDVTKGRDARITVSNIEGIDTLYLTNVQGETFSNGNSLRFYNNNTIVNLGVTTTFRGNSIPNTGLYAGNIMEVSQINHGMNADNNIIRISGIEPDTEPVLITQPFQINDVNVSVADTTKFATFEGITTSRGYLIVNGEVIQYTSIGNGTLGIARSEDASYVRPYDAGTICFKYELNGMSLTKINAQHDMTTNGNLSILRDIDKYYIEISRGDRETGATQLNFQTEKYSGGTTVEGSQNYQFSSIVPQFNIITPGQGTEVSAQLRTVSGTSAGGNEPSFIDQGYQPVEINKVNFLPTPRLVCSEINESVRLSSLPRNKSLTFKVRMTSQDPNLSPVLDLQQGMFIIGRNKINNPIGDYASDGRVNLVTGDPHSSIYISKRVDLSQPATSLKVYVAANRSAESDFRVLYQTFKADSSGIEQSFNLFPGYDNLQNVGIRYNIIDPSKNSGRPDVFVRPSRANEFLDYEFSIDNLDPFVGFVIKIVMSSTNESKPVKLQDLRVIALA